MARVSLPRPIVHFLSKTDWKWVACGRRVADFPDPVQLTMTSTEATCKNCLQSYELRTKQSRQQEGEADG
jgi:hypothetical protein